MGIRRGYKKRKSQEPWVSVESQALTGNLSGILQTGNSSYLGNLKSATVEVFSPGSDLQVTASPHDYVHSQSPKRVRVLSSDKIKVKGH